MAGTCGEDECTSTCLEESGTTLSPSPPLSRIGVNTHKAGMEGLDKAKINQIILEASKGSSYYQNELKKEQKASERIAKLLEDLKKITTMEKLAAEREAEKDVIELEVSRDLCSIIVHVDMDAFYAAVEMRDDPKLRTVPMAVGGNSMLSTSNYLARRFGVRAGMPGFIGKKLCPELVIVGLNFDKYHLVSEEVRKILAEYDPQFCPVGLDESYLNLTEYVAKKMSRQHSAETPIKNVQPSSTEDVTCEEVEVHVDSCVSEENCEVVRKVTSCDAMLLQSGDLVGSADLVGQSMISLEAKDEMAAENCEELGDEEPGFLPHSHWKCAEEVVNEIRARIEKCTSLTASAGIAPNKMLAKVASDLNKPNGQYTVPFTREGVLQFVRNLPIRKIVGIGKVTEKMLNALGIFTCKNLYDQRGVLRLLFSRLSSQHFLRISLGIGSSEVHSEWERKSISTERTFTEINSSDQLQQKCRDLCSCLARDVAQEGLKGKTVTLKLKMVSFQVRQCSTSFSQPISEFDEIYQAASTLLAAEMKACAPLPLRVRLMGVRLSSLLLNSSPYKRNLTIDAYFQTENFKRPKKDSSKHVVKDSNTTVTTTKSNLNAEEGIYEQSICPVCGQIVYGDNVLLNRHVDECLNQEFLNDIHD